MGRLADRLVAILMLAIGVFCFWTIYVDLSERIGGDGTLVSSIRIAALLAGGMICLAGARWLLSTDPAAQEQPANAPLFGRGARVQPVQRRPGQRLLLIAVPVVVLCALVADHFGPWRTRESAVAESVDSEARAPEPIQVQPKPDMNPASKAPATLDPAAVPASEPATLSETGQQAKKQNWIGEATKTAKDANLPASEPAASASETSSDGGNWIEEAMNAGKREPAREDGSWPELVLAPNLESPPPLDAPTTPPVAEPQAAPQTTTAPLPKPEQLPTQADGHRNAVVWLALSPDGRSAMSASTDRTIKLWDLDTKRLIRDVGVHKDMARTALFLPDGKRAVTAGDDGEIVLRDLADGAVLHVFLATQHGGANKIALTSDGETAVSVHEAGTVIVWDIENRSVVHVMSGHDWPIVSVAVSPNGSKAISGSIDGTLKLWDINAGRPIRSWLGHQRGTYGAVFTPDGREVITGSGDYTIKIWDVETGREVRQLNGHSGTVYALQISQDGKRLVSCSLDGTARLWDIATGHEIEQFSTTSGPLYAVAFAPDGSILTGGIDRAIRKWPGGDVLFAGAPD